LVAVCLLAACRPNPEPESTPVATSMATPVATSGAPAEVEPIGVEPVADGAEEETTAVAWEARIEDRAGGRRLVARGPVTAPTPGHEPVVEQNGPVENGILRLSVGFLAQPGFWTQVMTPKTARFEMAMPAEAIRAVEIVERGRTIATVEIAP
jgi:hypothetical protein